MSFITIKESQRKNPNDTILNTINIFKDPLPFTSKVYLQSAAIMDLLLLKGYPYSDIGTFKSSIVNSIFRIMIRKEYD